MDQLENRAFDIAAEVPAYSNADSSPLAACTFYILVSDAVPVPFTGALFVQVQEPTSCSSEEIVGGLGFGQLAK